MPNQAIKVWIFSMKQVPVRILMSICALVFSVDAAAYMGPTFGLGIVGTIIAIVAVSLLSLFAFIILPVRKMLRKSKDKKDSNGSGASQ